MERKYDLITRKFVSVNNPNGYPLELLKHVAENYTTQLPAYTGNTAGLENVGGRTIVRSSCEVVAVFEGERYGPLPYIDLGLWEKGVQFFIDGKPYAPPDKPIAPSQDPPPPCPPPLAPPACTAEPSTLKQALEALSAPPAQSNFPLFGKDCTPEQIIPTVNQLLGVHTAKEVLEELLNALHSHPDLLEQQGVEGVANAYRVRKKLSSETALLLLLCFFPGADCRKREYALPWMHFPGYCGRLCAKTPDELLGILQLATQRLLPEYPQMPLLVSELMLPVTHLGLCGLDLLLAKALMLPRSNGEHTRVYTEFKKFFH